MWRTLRRLAQTVVILLMLYMVLIGGFVTGLRQYHWRLITVILLLLLIGGWVVIKWFRAAPHRTGLELPLLLMLAASLLSTIFSTDPRLSAGRLALNVTLAILLYLTLDWLRDRRRADMLFNALLLVSGVVIAVGLIEYWQWFSGDLIAPVSWRESGLTWNLDLSLRIKSVMHNPNYLAYFLLIPTALVTVRLLTTTSNVWRFVWVCLGGVTLLSVSLARSRGGMLGAIAVVLVVTGMMAWVRRGQVEKQHVRPGRRLAGLLFLLLVVILMLLPVLGRLNLGGPVNLNQRDVLWGVSRDIALDYPLLGSGPASFPTQYFVYRPLDESTAIFTHAHNVWLTIVAEYGLLGLGAVLFFFGTVAFIVFRYLRRTPSGQWSPVLISGVALLAGQAVHNLVDDFMEFPVFSWFTILAVALCLAPMPFPSLQGWQRRVWLGVTTVAALLILLYSVWLGRAFALYDQARVVSQRGDWQQAAGYLEQAVTIDPSFRFYHQQLALAYGQLAGQDRAYASLALAEQQQVYPAGHYPPDAAYLGCLYRELGQSDEALALMRTAAETTPAVDGGFFSWHLGRETFQFNLGHYQEELGRADEALQNYGAVFDWAPVATSHYWQLTDLRRRAEARYGDSAPYSSLYYQARDSLAAGHHTEALQTIKQAIILTNAEHRPPFYTLWGDLARQQQQPDVAIRNYELAISTSLTPRTDYANLVPQREPLATELPYCILIPFPAEYLARPALGLAETKLAGGDIAGAVAVYHLLLRYEPNNLAAAQALAEVQANHPDLDIESNAH
jgi:putative inorganic carbon (HCO3(-)) transporter